MRYVVRETMSPELDLLRNWSTYAGGSQHGEMLGDSIEEAIEMLASHYGCEISEINAEFRYHNGLEKYAQVHYEGLGAWEIQASSIEEAIEKAKKLNGLACTMEAGNGHFFAEDVVEYIEVEADKYIFILND